jgi:hypothetical protein
MSVGGPASGGSMIGGRAGSNDEMRRAARRSSVMLTFRSISMRGLNHLAGFAKEKDKKDDDQEQPTNLVYGKSLEEVMALQMVLLLFSPLLASSFSSFSSVHPPPPVIDSGLAHAVINSHLQISHPDEKIPIILKTLTKAIIDTQGNSSTRDNQTKPNQSDQPHHVSSCV